MKILILGITGTFGTALERVCIEKNIEYIGLSHSDIEITNPDELQSSIKKHKPDVIVNSVAILGIEKCEKCPQEAFNVNSIAVSYLAKICQEEDIILVQPSTNTVFDGTMNGVYTEDDIPNPTNIYSNSKYAAECFAKNLCDKHYVVRFPMLFGNRKNEGLGFVDKVLKWIKEGKTLRIADDKIDSPTYTIDAAKLVLSLLENNKPYGIYHIANKGIVNYYDFVMEIIRILDIDAEILPAKDEDFPSVTYKPLVNPIKSIKLKPIRSWEEALKEYLTEDFK